MNFGELTSASPQSPKRDIRTAPSDRNGSAGVPPLEAIALGLLAVTHAGAWCSSIRTAQHLYEGWLEYGSNAACVSRLVPSSCIGM